MARDEVFPAATIQVGVDLSHSMGWESALAGHPVLLGDRVGGQALALGRVFTRRIGECCDDPTDILDADARVRRKVNQVA